MQRVVIIGGGPAGLMAAEIISQAGFEVDVYDTMPSVGRKLLLAGIGGLNITHSEDFTTFCQRYDANSQTHLTPLLQQFGAEQLQQWCADLGVETFVGTSGRVFPKEMKAAPLLRAWLARLKQHGVKFHPRHRWLGWQSERVLRFQHPHGETVQEYDALVLALGGGSWKKLGSDGAWLPLLQAQQIAVNPLQPSNCGFLCHWSSYISQRFAGAPLKSVALSFTDQDGQCETRMGEMILTERGVEGSLIYAFSARLRAMLQAKGQATFTLDLLPHHSLAQISDILRQKPRHKTLSSYLKTRLKLDAAKAALLFETLDKNALNDTGLVAYTLKAIPVTVIATTPIDEAISTAGGVCWAALNSVLMLKNLPSVFCAGEMIDWDAPTGGYLLTACFATGLQAGHGVVRWLQQR